MYSFLLFLISALAAVGEVQNGEIALPRDGKIWVVDTETAQIREVCDLPNYDRPLTWSPDGERILFWKHSEVGWNFWTVRSDGSDMRQLTNTQSGGFRSANYSKDGERIAYMRDLPGGLYVMDADGTGQQRLTDFGHRDFVPSWSPDGKQLLFFNLGDTADRSSKSGLYLASTTPNAQSSPKYLFRGHDASFSPVRNEIVAIANNNNRRSDVFVLELENFRKRKLAASEQGAFTATWSPDGPRLHLPDQLA